MTIKLSSLKSSCSKRFSQLTSRVRKFRSHFKFTIYAAYSNDPVPFDNQIDVDDYSSPRPTVLTVVNSTPENDEIRPQPQHPQDPQSWMDTWYDALRAEHRQAGGPLKTAWKDLLKASEEEKKCQTVEKLSRADNSEHWRNLCEWDSQLSTRLRVSATKRFDDAERDYDEAYDRMTNRWQRLDHDEDALSRGIIPQPYHGEVAKGTERWHEAYSETLKSMITHFGLKTSLDDDNDTNASDIPANNMDIINDCQAPSHKDSNLPSHAEQNPPSDIQHNSPSIIEPSCSSPIIESSYPSPMIYHPDISLDGSPGYTTCSETLQRNDNGTDKTLKRNVVSAPQSSRDSLSASRWPSWKKPKSLYKSISKRIGASDFGKRTGSIMRPPKSGRKSFFINGKTGTSHDNDRSGDGVSHSINNRTPIGVPYPTSIAGFPDDHEYGSDVSPTSEYGGNELSVRGEEMSSMNSQPYYTPPTF